MFCLLNIVNQRVHRDLKGKLSEEYLLIPCRVRQWVTMIKITDITFDFNPKVNTNIIFYNIQVQPIDPPKRLLDLWANRWLHADELQELSSRITHPTVPTNAPAKTNITGVYRFDPDPFL